MLAPARQLLGGAEQFQIILSLCHSELFAWHTWFARYINNLGIM